MLYDQDVRYVNLPDGVYPDNFLGTMLSKSAIERVFKVIGYDGLLAQPISPEVKERGVNYDETI